MSTPLTLGFYAPRANYLKIMGPVIDEAVRVRAHEFRAMLLVPDWNASKPHLRINPETLPAHWKGRVDIHLLPSPDALRSLVADERLQALLSVQPALSDMSQAEADALRHESIRRGVKWVALPEGFSQNGYLVTRAPAVIAHWDVVCTVGPHSIRYVEGHLSSMSRAIADALRPRIRVVGYPEFDGLASLRTAHEIRTSYGLPLDRPIVLLATAARSVPLSVNTWTARGLDARFRGEVTQSTGQAVAAAVSMRYPRIISYRAYLEAIRRFADRQGACVVAKTRQKHRDPQMLHDLVDAVIDDRDYFPFTTLELASVARLYCGIYSNTVSEAIACGVYAITALHVPPPTIQEDPGWREFGYAMTWGPGGLWARPGLSHTIAGTTRAGRDALATLADASFDDFRVDPDARREVMRDFFNHPCNSSSLVLDAIAEQCAA